MILVNIRDVRQKKPYQLSVHYLTYKIYIQNKIVNLTGNIGLKKFNTWIWIILHNFSSTLKLFPENFDAMFIYHST